jgi:hypothetical protein
MNRIRLTKKQRRLLKKKKPHRLKITPDEPLPKKMSQCLKLALRDLRRCEKKKRYRVEMDVAFHHPNDDGTCSVDVGGALTALTLGGQGRLRLVPMMFERKTYDMLCAVSVLVSGNISGAIRMLYPEKHSDVAVRKHGLPLHVDITPYDKSPRQFRRDLRRLAALMGLRGL